MANLSVPPGGDGSAIGFTSDDHSFYLRHDDEWWTIDVVDDRAPHVALSGSSRMRVHPVVSGTRGKVSCR